MFNGPIDRLERIVADFPTTMDDVYSIATLEAALASIEDALNEIVDPEHEFFRESLEILIRDLTLKHDLHPSFSTTVEELSSILAQAEYGQILCPKSVVDDKLYELRSLFEELVGKLKNNDD